MRSIANANPQNLAALNAISGMGPSKVDRYGAAILAVCRGDTLPQATTSTPKQPPKPAQQKTTTEPSPSLFVSPTNLSSRPERSAVERPAGSPSAVRENKRPTPPPARPTELTATQQALDAKLRDWRKQQAATAGLPSFFILSDTALRNIALAEPRSLTDLHNIRGLDAEKLHKFGPAVLQLCTS